MKWQHWLKPVGQYTSMIVAVKSQFVFGVSSVGFSLRRKLLRLGGQDARKGSAALGGPSFGRAGNETNDIARQPSINEARSLVSLAQAEAYATAWRIFRPGGACALAAFCAVDLAHWD